MRGMRAACAASDLSSAASPVDRPSEAVAAPFAAILTEICTVTCPRRPVSRVRDICRAMRAPTCACQLAISRAEGAARAAGCRVVVAGAVFCGFAPACRGDALRGVGLAGGAARAGDLRGFAAGRSDCARTSARVAAGMSKASGAAAASGVSGGGVNEGASGGAGSTGAGSSARVGSGGAGSAWAGSGSAGSGSAGSGGAGSGCAGDDGASGVADGSETGCGGGARST